MTKTTLSVVSLALFVTRAQASAYDKRFSDRPVFGARASSPS
jgi:hypothetical protein